VVQRSNIEVEWKTVGTIEHKVPSCTGQVRDRRWFCLSCEHVVTGYQQPTTSTFTSTSGRHSRRHTSISVIRCQPVDQERKSSVWLSLTRISLLLCYCWFGDQNTVWSVKTGSRCSQRSISSVCITGKHIWHKLPSHQCHQQHCSVLVM